MPSPPTSSPPSPPYPPVDSIPSSHTVTTGRAPTAASAVQAFAPSLPTMPSVARMLGASSPASPSLPLPATIALSRTVALAPGLKIIAIDDLPSLAEPAAATARTPKIVDIASCPTSITRSGIPSGGAMVVG
ncbi:hypothetical protein SCE1572_36225 [Sorangium cellulosum So0157-2]|uniref:Uncharacterized protein n=1 Tax=Sorangium cellulosum So0157-2 TaxID=1254432 RepID=S4Y9J4_SORCE|nr:hypothetical protein SCE1572_36225 [Sorangium cellulosum So0157-2]